jgi:hypothetical protein
VVNGILGYAARQRAPAPVPASARLAQDDIFMFGIADLANGGVTVFVDLPNLA